MQKILLFYSLSRMHLQHSHSKWPSVFSHLSKALNSKSLESVSMFQYKSNLLKLFQVHLNWGNIKLNFCVCRSICLPQVEHNNWKMCHMLRPFRKWGNIYNSLLPVKQRYFSYNLPTDKLQGHKIATKFLSGVNTLLTS